jgi:hypothetical protein
VLDALHRLVLVVEVRHDARQCCAELGLEVALEALREVHRKRRCTPDAIMRCATKCSVSSVVRPYLEAMA